MLSCACLVLQYIWRDGEPIMMILVTIGARRVHDTESHHVQAFALLLYCHLKFSILIVACAIRLTAASPHEQHIKRRHSRIPWFLTFCAIILSAPESLFRSHVIFLIAALLFWLYCNKLRKTWCFLLLTTALCRSLDYCTPPHVV